MREERGLHVTDGGLSESTLRDVLSGESLLSIEQVVRLGIDITDDLLRLQSRGVFCHELSPNDIVLKGRDQKPHIAVTTTQEESGVRLRRPSEGPSCYVSPEVAHGDPPDALSNVWLVGALLLEMLTGKPPFSPRKSTRSNGEYPCEEAPDLREFRNDVPETLAVMIYQMLDTDRDLRLRSVELARTELERYRGNLFPSPLPDVSERDEDLQNIAYTLTRFVGREEELSRIAQLFAEGQCRLLTLIGPGGVGKSRLAFHVAEQQAEHFNDGVYFVPLTPVRSAAFIALAIGNTLRFSFSGQREPVQQLIDHLKTRQLLLVLDNFDHLLQGAELVTELLAKTDDVRVIVTSRERLNLHQERLLEVKGLPVPADVHADDAENYSSVQLFRENAERMHSSFSLIDTERSHVIRICRLLEGLPLGIVLASGWVRALTCEEIAQEIEQGIGFLATKEHDMPEQHRSMRAALNRSWWLLSEHERTVLMRLCVFHGGFRRIAAEEIGGASLKTLSAFVDKSLLQRDSFGRYQIHELLRQYLTERLEDAPDELDRIRESHASFFAMFLYERNDRLMGEEEKSALEEIERELGNIQKGWEWAIKHKRLPYIDKSIVSLYALFQTRGWLEEGRRLFDRVLVAAEGSDDPDSARILGRAQARQGALSIRLGKYEEARELLEESLEPLRKASARDDEAFALRNLGHVAVREGSFEEGKRIGEECLALGEAMEDRRVEAGALNDLGEIAMRLGKYDDAEILLSRSLELSKELKNQREIACCLNNLGGVARFRGDILKAREYYEEGLLVNREVGDKTGISSLLNNLGSIAHTLGEIDSARGFYQEALEISRDIGRSAGIAYSLYALGNICHSVGEFSEARRLHEESVSISKKTGHMLGVASALYGLGSAVMASGHTKEARSVFEESLHLYRKLNEPWGKAKCLRAYGTAVAALGDKEKSIASYREALSTAMEINASNVALEVVIDWAGLLETEGNQILAAELFEMVRVHESTDHVGKTRAVKSLENLASLLPHEDMAAALAKGTSRRLEEVVEELLEEG